MQMTKNVMVFPAITVDSTFSVQATVSNDQTVSIAWPASSGPANPCRDPLVVSTMAYTEFSGFPCGDGTVMDNPDDADDDVELAVEAGGRDREGGGLHQGLGVKVFFDGLAVDDDDTGTAGKADAGRGGLTTADGKDSRGLGAHLKRVRAIRPS